MLLGHVPTEVDLHPADNAMERFHALLDALPAMVWTARPDGSRPFVNGAWTRYTGKDVLDWESALHPDDRDAYLVRWRDASSGNRPFESDLRLWHAGSRRFRWVAAHAARAPIGHDDLWIGTTMDIDERKRRELANEFLARAGMVLNQTLSIDDTFLQLAMLAIGSMADYCVFYLLDRGKVLRSLWRHRDPALQPLLDEAIATGPDPSDPAWLVARVMETNQSLSWKRGEIMPRSYKQSPRYREVVGQLDLSAVLTVPVRLRTQVYGAFALARTGDREPFDELDVQTIEQLAERAAIALANASIYEREHRIALTFQSAALPDAISTRDGIEIDAHYVAARSEARIGGDWYDTELLPDGRILISIGDVSGSGLEAAVVMSMMRTAIRSVAHVYADPATILEAAHGATERRLKNHFATVFIGLIDPVLGRFTYSSAGHTRPLLLVDDRAVELRGEGLPVGMFFDETRVSTTIELPQRCTVVMFTDGLTEGAGEFLPGEDAVRAFVESQEFRERPTATALYQALLPDGGSDDVAILIARIALPDASATTIRVPLLIRTAEEAARARDLICARIEDARLLEGEALENARLIVGELTANVSRHAPGDAVALLDRWTECPVFHLVDRGEGFRYSNRLPPIFAESGRGLFIASALARRLEVLPDLDGGSHVIAVLDP